CNRCVRFATTVASGHATLATKRTLLLTWAGLPPAGSHQLCLAHSFDHLVGAGEQDRWNIETIALSCASRNHAHMLLGTACISSASAAPKLRSPNAAPL